MSLLFPIIQNLNISTLQIPSSLTIKKSEHSMVSYNIKNVTISIGHVHFDLNLPSLTKGWNFFFHTNITMYMVFNYKSYLEKSHFDDRHTILFRSITRVYYYWNINCTCPGVYSDQTINEICGFSRIHYVLRG